MDKSLYISMTGASQNAMAQRAHANNLANLTTTGFRRDFEQARSMPVFGDGYATRAYAMTERPGTDMSAGVMQETGRELDVAVQGEGWIAVQAADGTEAYTRAGSLNIDAFGVLRTSSGLPVLGNGGPIAIPPAQKVEIGSDGTISIRALGEGVQKEDGTPERRLGRHRGRDAVLGLDRRHQEVARRPGLPPADHAQDGAEHLVEAQHRARGAPDPRGPHGGAGPRAGACGEGGRPMGERVPPAE